MRSIRRDWVLAFVCLWACPAGGAPAPDRAAWGEAVVGLKARLLSRKTQYRTGEPVHLTLEIVNVSKETLVIEAPELMPLISYPGSHPYRRRPYPWVITCEVPGRSVCILWAERETLRRVRELVRLRPGEVYRVEITATSHRAREEKEQERRAGELQRETVSFVGADSPGTYLLRAAFATPGAGRKLGEGMWTGRKLQTPAVRIEVVR
jgi:hypothetical protein